MTLNIPATERPLSASALKTAAFILMIINHAMYVLLPVIPGAPAWVSQLHWFITRPSFVLFAFLTAEGVRHTRSVKNYLLRLFAMALISEIPFDLCIRGTLWSTDGQNVFFTLFLGAAAVYEMDRLRDDRTTQSMVLLGACMAAVLLKSDYDATGVLLIAAMYFLRDDLKKCALVSLLILFFGTGLTVISGYLPGRILWDRVLYYAAMEAHGMLAFALIALYNGKKGRQLPKPFYYSIYPVHLLIIAAIHLAG